MNRFSSFNLDHKRASQKRKLVQFGVIASLGAGLKMVGLIIELHAWGVARRGGEDALGRSPDHARLAGRAIAQRIIRGRSVISDHHGGSYSSLFQEMIVDQPR